MPFWFRHRHVTMTSDLPQYQAPVTPRVDVEESDRRLLVMAVNHLHAFVVISYLLYAICRFGFGWDPLKDPPPPTYKVHIPGITD